MSEKLVIPITEEDSCHEHHLLPQQSNTTSNLSYVIPIVDGIADDGSATKSQHSSQSDTQSRTATVQDFDEDETKMLLARKYVVEEAMSVAQAALQAGVSYYKLSKALKHDQKYIDKQNDSRKKRALNREIDEGIMKEIRKECQDPTLKISPTTLRKYRRIALAGIRAKQTAMPGPASMDSHTSAL